MVTKKIRAKLTITVTAPGVTGPTGVLTIKDGTKTLKKLTLSSTKKGVLVFKLPKLKPGKHKLKVSYAGSGVVAPSTGKLVVKVGR